MNVIEIWVTFFLVLIAYLLGLYHYEMLQTLKKRNRKVRKKK